MKKLNAAQILDGFIWKKKPSFCFKIDKNGKIYIEQQELLNYVLEVQEFIFINQPKTGGTEMMSNAQGLFGRAANDPKISGTTYTEPICPKCGKPYIYAGDVPEEGWPKGMAPICEGHSEEQIFIKTTPNMIPNMMGWECPRCHKINAPFIPSCDCPAKTWTASTDSPFGMEQE